METSIEPRSIATAAYWYAADVADFHKIGFDRKSARRIATDKMIAGFTADLMYFDGCSLEVAECRAADLAATALTFERRPADDNASDSMLTWLRSQMPEPQL